ELPWNPMRLEQRIGRVDRIGQTRRVHAFHLIAAGTQEERILARLHGRIAAARESIDAPDPLGSSVPAPGSLAATTATPELRDVARSEAGRLAIARAMSSGAASTDVLGALEDSRWWLCRARRSATRAMLAGRVLFVYRVASDNGAGRIVASRLLPL